MRPATYTRKTNDENFEGLFMSAARVPTHPGKSWIFSWIFQALESPGKSVVLESPGNESLRSWKVLENEDPGYLMNLLGVQNKQCVALA